MLNIRLANTPLFCTHDIDAIFECAAEQISSVIAESGEELFSANQIGNVVLENIESRLQNALDDLRDMRVLA